MPHTLIIRHSGELEFLVTRPDGKISSPVTLTPPDAVQVEGRPNSNLLQDLRWYLEKFLDYPFHPNTQIAERTQVALQVWGEDTFTRLFTGQPLLWYDRARNEGLPKLTLKIASDDPRILAWPWEALRDPEGTTLAYTCCIERLLSELHDPLPLPEQLPTDRINILLIIARPYGDSDVGYHALSRPLIELVSEQRLPVRVDVLRPPTFTQLEQRLRQRSGFYHIVHFDGHGGYGEAGHTGSPHEYRGAEGRLIFEDDAGEVNAVTAGKLTQLLTEYRIPIMVLNACQSARIDERADDPFASVAAALLKAGIRAVVAMGYNLFVSGAQQFVPAFYRRLLENGDVAEATRAGRRAMLEQDARACVLGKYPLEDWLVPVLYQQDAMPLPVVALQTNPILFGTLPEEAQELGDYGFIGRQRAIHALERAIFNQPAAGLLVHGMAGVGKTTLAKGYLHWLQQTNGLGSAEDHGLFAGVFWFGFDDIRTAEFLINRLVESLFGHDATAQPMEEKQAALIDALREHPMLIIWDNFESAAGIPDTEVTPLLSDEDRQQLKTLLKKLRGGKSKILITSRSSESWLTPTEAYRLPLGGLSGEERWEYCNAVVRDLGLRIQRDDTHYAELMDELDGHPLAMRAVLLRLEEKPAEQLLVELKKEFAGAVGDESTRRIFAALDLLDHGLPDTYSPLLQLIGLHRRYVDINFLEVVYKGTARSVERETLNHCFTALEKGGLLHHQSNDIYRMHPALSGFLAGRHPADEAQQRGFIDFMVWLADQFARKALHEQRFPFAMLGASFQHALGLAVDLHMDIAVASLYQSLAAFAQNNRDFTTTMRLLMSLAEHFATMDHQEGLASTYYNLGRVAHEQRDFASSEQWYKKSLAISEKHGDEHGAAKTYHSLGIIAQDQRDFTSAEQGYKKSLAIFEKQGNAHGAASIYHELGRIAEERRHFANAEQWYKKSLAIFEKQGDEHWAAKTYHHLGIIAQAQRDFSSAEQWYKKSLAIEEKQGNEHGAAITYDQLGRIAQEQQDFTSAEQWYKKSLAISEKQGDEHGAASTYYNLGTIAEEQRDFSSAEHWCMKSLAIQEKQGDEQGAASTYHELGRIAHEQRDFANAEQWYKKSLTIREKQGDEHGAAFTYGQFGYLALDQRDFASAGEWFLKTITLFDKVNDLHNLATVVNRYAEVLHAAEAPIQTDLRQRWREAGLDRLIPLDKLEQQSND